MSASSKKKLRKENAAAQLTEKQQKERAEAKKLKTISVVFVAVMLVVALTAASIMIVRAVNNSGIIDRNTIAATTGNHQLNSVQMNYYFTDYVNKMYSQWQNTYGDSTSIYLEYMGLNPNKALDKQVYDEETGETWADFFLKEAMEVAKSDYALYDKAVAENFTLSEEEQKYLDSYIQQMSLYAAYAGYSDNDKYLSSIYGYGSDVESYTHYTKVSSIASAYYAKHSESLTYDDAAIREYEKDKYINYTSFDFARYYVSTNEYIQGGTTNESGGKDYTEAEKQAAIKAAEEVANSLVTSKNVVELDAAIAALEINKDKKNVASTKSTDLLYPQIPLAIQEWLADEKRVENDIAVIPNESTSKDEAGNETKTIIGYYVVVFQGRNENLRHLANVRHLLVEFQGGTTNSSGNKTYSDKEKETAKAEAERLLNVWKEGAATQDTFIALVKEYSDDTSAESGGLFEDIHPASGYVENFLNWSIDKERKAGDTGIIESEFGYHVMYYVGDDELTYRDYMISEDMRAEDMQEWYDGILEGATITMGNIKRVNTDKSIASII